MLQVVANDLDKKLRTGLKDWWRRGCGGFLWYWDWCWLIFFVYMVFKNLLISNFVIPISVIRKLIIIFFIIITWRMISWDFFVSWIEDIWGIATFYTVINVREMIQTRFVASFANIFIVDRWISFKFRRVVRVSSPWPVLIYSSHLPVLWLK